MLSSTMFTIFNRVRVFTAEMLTITRKYVCVCAASSVIASVSLSRRIPQSQLHRTNERPANIFELCVGSEAHTLFLVDSSYGNNVVRAFDVSASRLDACDVFRSPDGESVQSVQYSSELHSLLIASWLTDLSGVIVRSLARNNTCSEWTESNRLPLKSENSGFVFLRVLRDGTVLCSQRDTNGMNVCRVLPDRSLQHCARVELPEKHWGFDAQLIGSERRLAAALWGGSVALFRVEATLVPISSVHVAEVIGARIPLFCNDSLLVGVKTDNDFNEIVLLSTTGGKLQLDKQLIAPKGRLDIECWCFVEGTIYAWEFQSGELLVYTAH